ncbi:MAG: cysteine--tRNA ligase [Patescibacteria group bacterium]
MEINLWNSLTRKKEKFEPIHEGKVGMYSCGPTVYQRASIGNFRSYIFSDLLRRCFEFNGYEVAQVVNITDVGHLTDDASEGEDKLEKSAREMEKSAWDIAAEYTELFKKDMERLNIETPIKMPKATDHIDEQIQFIEAIEKAGFAYTISDGVYFDTSKLSTYGDLAGQKLEDKEEGARVSRNAEKKNPTDFALWKFSRPEEHRQMEWQAPWGMGFPGWHIECSAMSEKYLDVPFDIHTGGIDHIPVHHTNEIAQTEAARGVNPAHYWMHNAFLLIDGGKMSKSLHNTYSVDDLVEKGFEPLALRYFFLGAHYRVQQNFTWEALEASQHAIENLRTMVRDWDKPGKPDVATMDAFITAVNDDLDMPKALAIVWEMTHNDTIPSEKKSATLVKCDEVLGLSLGDYIAKPIEVPESIKDLLRQRDRAREKKDFETSDKLRDEIFAQGFTVEDTAGGQVVHEAKP